MKLKKVSIDVIIDIVIFIYIISLYIFSYRENLYIISNILTFIFVGLVAIRIILKENKLVLNSLLIWNFMFIIFCLFSSLYSLNTTNAITEVRTLILLFIVMIAIVNYVDNFQKIEKIMNYFVYAGTITSVYILISSDLSISQRFGSQLGNVNEIGMIIGISSVLSLSNFIKSNNKLWLLLVIPMITVIFLTGSRKSILFVTFATLLITYLTNKTNLKGKIRFLIFSSIVIVLLIYIIFYIPFFYNIIGTRLEGLMNFVSNEGTVDSSTLVRKNMISFGASLFSQKPLLGYGADNYRVMYSFMYGSASYSHNNFIELLVNVGVIGTFLYYAPQFLLIKKLFTNSKKTKCFNESLIMFTFIAIIIVYFGIGVSLVYYRNKHFSIIVALASTVFRTYKKSQITNDNFSL